jgi:hypothetical protein
MPQAAGTYTVTITSNNCAETSPTVTVNFLPTPLPPVVQPVGSTSFCAGGSVQLTANSGYTGYLWNDGSTLQTLNALQSGDYYVYGYGANGCRALSDTFRLNTSLFLPPSICMVTVDDAINKNRIIWESPITSGIDSFIIYRESSIANNYIPIGVVGYEDLSEFVDTGSVPEQNSNRYKLAILDTCGSTSLPGDFHRTIHLSVNAGQPGTGGNPTWNLVWNSYEGLPVVTYEIYRGTSPGNLTLIGSLAASGNSLNLYTDPNPPIGFVYYQVLMDLPTTCTSVDRAQYNKTRSNVGQNEIYSGLLENSGTDFFDFAVLPNPNDGEFQIRLDILKSQDVSLEIYNSLGQVVKAMPLGKSVFGKTIGINLSEVAKGIYYVRLQSQTHTTTKRVVIQ